MPCTQKLFFIIGQSRNELGLNAGIIDDSLSGLAFCISRLSCICFVFLFKPSFLCLLISKLRHLRSSSDDVMDNHRIDIAKFRRGVYAHLTETEKGILQK